MVELRGRIWIYILGWIKILELVLHIIILGDFIYSTLLHSERYDKILSVAITSTPQIPTKK